MGYSLHYIKIASKQYLENLQMMLKKFNIFSSIFKSENLFTLSITRRTSLEKLSSMFNLFVKYKQDKLIMALNSYQKDRMPHYKAEFNYLSALRDAGPINVKVLSDSLGKNPSTIRIELNRLEKKGYVNKSGRKFLGRKTTPWIYEISSKGLEYLTYEDTRM